MFLWFLLRSWGNGETFSRLWPWSIARNSCLNYGARSLQSRQNKTSLPVSANKRFSLTNAKAIKTLSEAGIFARFFIAKYYVSTIYKKYMAFTSLNLGMHLVCYEYVFDEARPTWKSEHYCIVQRQVRWYLPGTVKLGSTSFCCLTEAKTWSP